MRGNRESRCDKRGSLKELRATWQKRQPESTGAEGKWSRRPLGHGIRFHPRKYETLRAVIGGATHGDRIPASLVRGNEYLIIGDHYIVILGLIERIYQGI